MIYLSLMLKHGKINMEKNQQEHHLLPNVYGHWCQNAALLKW